jgi:hypothetical protein
MLALPLTSPLSVVVTRSLLPLDLLRTRITRPPLVPAVTELLDPTASVERVVSGVVAIALEAELRVAAAEDELLPVAHGGCPGRVICGDVVPFGARAWCWVDCRVPNGSL